MVSAPPRPVPEGAAARSCAWAVAPFLRHLKHRLKTSIAHSNALRNINKDTERRWSDVVQLRDLTWQKARRCRQSNGKSDFLQVLRGPRTESESLTFASKPDVREHNPDPKCWLCSSTGLSTSADLSNEPVKDGPRKPLS